MDMQPELAMNGIDKSIYRTDGELAAPRGGGMRVLGEGPVEVEFKNVPASIRIAREGGADEVWLLTASDVGRRAGGGPGFLPNSTGTHRSNISRM